MRARLSARFSGVMLLLLMVAGCASSGGQGDGPEVGSPNSSTLRVTGVPAVGSLTIYLIPDVGGRRMIGYVRTGQDTQLSFQIPGAGSYRFLAETLNRAGAVSNPVYLRAGTNVRWDLTSNIATVQD